MSFLPQVDGDDEIPVHLGRPVLRRIAHDRGFEPHPFSPLPPNDKNDENDLSGMGETALGRFLDTRPTFLIGAS